MSNTLNTKSDVISMIEDMPVDKTCYQINYVEIATNAYLDLIFSKGFSWGEEAPETTDKEFWDCFVPAERKKVLLNDKPVDFLACVELMDSDIREEIHDEYADSISDQDFLDIYAERHASEYEEEFAV